MITQEELEAEIQVVEKEQEKYLNSKEYKDFLRVSKGGHHDYQTFSGSGAAGYYSSLRICGLMTGCGAGQISGLASITESRVKEYQELLKQVKKASKATGMGMLVGTLGQAYWSSSHNAVLECGFVQIGEYANYRHGQGGGYKQRMYALYV